MASVVVHLLVGIFFWPFAVPFGALLGLLYSFYPISLVNAFIRFGGYIAVPGFTTNSVEVNGIEFSYMDRNPKPDNKQPTVVFVHGMSSQKLSWAPVIRSLPKSWRIIAIDLPGHGKSSFDFNKKYNAEGMCALFHGLFQTLKLRKFHLVGESIGAIFSAQYAYAHQDMLASVTFLCPPGGHRLEGGQSTPAMDILDKAGEDANTKNPLLPESAQEFRAMLDIVMYDPQRFTFHDHMLDAIVRVQSKHYPYIRRVLSDVINGGETAEEITRRTTNTDIPCLVIWGRDDKICHPSGAKLAKKLKPQTKVILLNECGHCISVDRPGKTARFITQFINKQSCVL